MAAAEGLNVDSWGDVAGEIVDVLSSKMEREGREGASASQALESVVSCPPLGLISNSKL